MAEETGAAKAGPPKSEYDVYLEERKLLIDAARESARTFDKAILTFAAAAFGFSVARLKEAAPHPAQWTLVWLGLSWTAFTVGLLAIMLSFLFSHRACTWSIERTYDELVIGGRPKINPWGRATTVLNYVTVGLLFFGISFWGIFVFANMRVSESKQSMAESSTPLKKGYVPPAPPVRYVPTQPANQPSSPPAPQPAPKK